MFAPCHFERAVSCHHLLMSNDGKDAARRWYKARQHELRKLLWDWDPLGVFGCFRR
jgi:hypothetical protein